LLVQGCLLLILGLRLRRIDGAAVFQKTRDDEPAYLSQRSAFLTVVKQLSHELSNDGIVFFLPKRPQTIRLRPAPMVVLPIENIAPRAVRDKLSKTAIGEIQHIPAVHPQKLLELAFFYVREIGHDLNAPPKFS
jgi:hypothetical protein